MRDHDPSDVIDADNYTVADLRKMVFEGQGELSRPLALSLLERKDYPEKVDDLERLLLNDDESSRMRSVAAVGLGRIGSPEAVAVLRRAAGTKDPATAGAVIRGLSLAGGGEERAIVDRLKRRRGSIGEAARNTAVMLSYRAGAVRGAEVDLPDRRLRINAKLATPIEVAPSSRDEAERALRHVTTIAPALRLTTDGAVSLQCQDARFMLLLNETAKAGLDQFADGRAELGVVAAQRSVEGVGWDLKYHVLTTPRSDGQIDVAVVSGRGRPVLAGSARIADGRAEFELKAVDGNGVLPVSLRGSFDGQSLEMTDARSNLRRRPSPAPAPMPKPDRNGT
jgi:hypothetical protein